MIQESFWIQCSNEAKCRGSGWYHLECAGIKAKPEEVENIDFVCSFCKRPEEDKESESSHKKFKPNWLIIHHILNHIIEDQMRLLLRHRMRSAQRNRESLDWARPQLRNCSSAHQSANLTLLKLVQGSPWVPFRALRLAEWTELGKSPAGRWTEVPLQGYWTRLIVWFLRKEDWRVGAVVCLGLTRPRCLPRYLWSSSESRSQCQIQLIALLRSSRNWRIL